MAIIDVKEPRMKIQSSQNQSKYTTCLVCRYTVRSQNFLAKVMKKY